MSSTPPRWLPIAWRSALGIAVGALFVPVIIGTETRAFSHIAGYVGEVASNVYRLVRGGMPWLAAGLLLSLVQPPWKIRAVALAALPMAAALTLLGTSGATTERLLRDLLYVLPALAAGLWLAACAARRPGAGGSERANSDSPQGESMTVPPPRASAATSAGRTIAGTPDSDTFRSGLILRLIGIVLVAAGIALALDLPRFGAPLAGCLLAYALLLWWRPLASLVVVPAALPLLDLAPWTGRIFLDEFDLLVGVTIGVLTLRNSKRSPAVLAPLATPAIVLFLASAMIAAGIGLVPVPPIDPNAFSSYFSPFNALRVGKGVLYGAMLFWIVRRTAASEALLVRLLCVGMGVGLLGVGLIGAWERWLFAGLSDTASTYRIVSTFSSMHTGGGHIEAYLVAALPFLWLGLFRLRTAIFTVPVLVLSAYVMLYTVARGGVLGFFVIVGILIVATIRSAWLVGLWRTIAPLVALTAVAAVVITGAGGGYLLKRFAQSAEDWNTRVAHWQLALQMKDDAWGRRLFGEGLGSFPRTYLWRGPADRQPAAFAYASEAGDVFLRMGVGETLYVAQRVAVHGGVSYRLTMDVRSREAGASLAAPLCEKQLLNSRRCDWHQVDVPGDGQWHTVTHRFSAATVGQGPAWRHLPVELYFYNAGKTGSIDIDRVELLDPQGHNLIGNGEFTQGSDFWFFKTQSHLPWHVKNFWVHTYFESGALGLLATISLALLALVRLARAGWKGSRLAWAILASLAGLLTVGVFDSLVDAPRLAMLLFGWLMIGAGMTWSPARASPATPH